jgi:hypothetical protein
MTLASPRSKGRDAPSECSTARGAWPCAASKTVARRWEGEPPRLNYVKQSGHGVWEQMLKGVASHFISDYIYDQSTP